MRFGQGGRRLSEHWAEGMRSLHGIHVHGFPNVFVVGPTQGANLISNVPHNLVEAASTIATIVSRAESVGAQTVEITAEVEQAWLDRLESGGRRFGNQPDCTPGYYNNEGIDPGRRGLRNSLGFPEGALAYFDYIDAWRNSGDFVGLTFDPER